MKKPNITPGPWLGQQTSRGFYAVTAEIRDCRTRTTVCAEVGGESITEEAANARLIAAAPQMAEALNDLTASFETLWRITCKDLPNDTLEAAKSALLAAGYTE